MDENDQITKNKPSLSSLSRNYSGSSVFYTPPELINCIFHGINYLLLKKFKIPLGLLDEKLEFIDPAAGMMAFPLGLVNYVKERASTDECNHWLREILLKNLFAFEIDPEICQSAQKVLTEKISSINSSISDFNQIFCENTLNNHQNHAELLKSLPLDQDNLIIIFGNPPYAVSSRNKSLWIRELIEDYKKDLNRKGKKRIVGLKGIQDDYVKFIRFAQWKLADQNNPGILAYVVNNYFLDGDIFRGMRSSLKKVFDEIWIINLHGDPKKSSLKTNFNGIEEKDENVFGIQTGICLFFAIKLKKQNLNKIKDHNCKIYYAECKGSKSTKNSFLLQEFENIPFRNVPKRLDFEFIPINEEELELEKKYKKFPYLPNIFQKNLIGVQSLHDTLVTHPDKKRLTEIITNFYDGTYSAIEFLDEKNQKWVKHQGVSYHDARDWNIKEGLQGTLKKALSHIIQWQWRGFDKWWVTYDSNLITRGSSSFSLMQFLLPYQNNIAIGVSRVSRKASGESSFFITNSIAESHFIEGGSGIGDYLFPLKINRLVNKKNKKNDWDNPKNAEDYNFAQNFLLKWIKDFNLTEEDLFYYIYGVLLTPSYRKRYGFLLKRDYPRIPFIFSKNITKKISILGKKLAINHTLSFSSSKIDDWPVGNHKDLKIYNVFYDSDEKRIYFKKPKQSDKNDQKNFWIGNITSEMWSFSIGGILQLNLWLKHRKYSLIVKKYSFNRGITKNELQTFLKICYSIKETLGLMKQLDFIYKKEE